MTIGFTHDKWSKIEKDYTSWWNGDLDRALINIELTGVEATLPKPREPIYNNTALYDFSVPAEVVVKHWEYILSCKKFVGDAFPVIIPDFGPAVNAAFMGAMGNPTEHTVWFKSENIVPMNELYFKYNPNEPWLLRIKELYRAAAEYFNGSVCLGMTHLNNGIDPVARFFESGTIALAFYDDPDNLKRLIWESHDLCMKYYYEFIESMGKSNPGFTCWGYMFSKVPHFMLQSDFSAMISPGMFKDFILPELEACCKKLGNPFYHLDGPGELEHLDMILSIPGLKGVQWIPGDGNPDYKHWPEVYKKIRKAGKLIQLFGDLETLEVVVEQLGSTKGIYYFGSADISEEEKVLSLIEKYGSNG